MATPVQSAPISAGETPEAVNGADEGIPGEAIVGLLAALGLGAVGYAAMRSNRRRADHDPEDAALGSETVSTPPEASLTPAPRTAPVVASSVGAARTAPSQPARSSRMGHSAAAGTALPTTIEERSELLDHMVAAEPDAANPFTSRKARRKRARLLLQQHEVEALRNDARFDWRTYQGAAPARPSMVPA